jgi:hypothetical protein
MTKNRIAVYLFAALVMTAAMAIAPRAEARVGVFLSYNCCGYYPYYPTYAYPYAYYAPPPVVYAAPPPVYVTQPPPSVLADQTSPTYVDSQGRTCRQYESGNTGGIACLMSDGTWHITQ